MDSPLQPIRVDEAAHRAWKGDQELTLAPLVFRCLARLARTPGVVVTPQQFMRDVWGHEWWGDSGPKSLYMHIGVLRRALGDDPKQPRYVQTVRGVGLRLAADAVAATPPAPPSTESSAWSVFEPTAYRLPLRIDRHGQTIYDADDVLVAAAMTPRAALWLVEVANSSIVEAEIVDQPLPAAGGRA